MSFYQLKFNYLHIYFNLFIYLFYFCFIFMVNSIRVIFILLLMISLKCVLIQPNLQFNSSSNIILHRLIQNNPYFVKNLLDFKISKSKAAFLSTNNANNKDFPEYDRLLHLVTMELTDFPTIIINKFVQLSQKLNITSPYYLWHSIILSVSPLIIAFGQCKLN